MTFVLIFLFNISSFDSEADMIEISSIEVWPKKNRKKVLEPGAFMVKITKYDGSLISRKWLKDAPNTHPTGTYLILSKRSYAKICDLINESHKTGKKVSWQLRQGEAAKYNFDKGAYANEMKAKAIGAC